MSAGEAAGPAVGDARRVARILVVDDDERNRRVLGAMLEADDYAVAEAPDGESALELARRDPPDAILLDVMMPGIDGYEVARRLKADDTTRAIPLVMLTTLDDRGSRVAALEAGAEEFVTKPVDRVELLARVRNLVRLRTIMAELERARDAARAADRAKSTFLATMSHEIRTPMNGVIGTLEILGRSALQPGQAELVNAMHDSAKSLLGVIDGILDFSKIEAGGLELERHPFSLARLAQSACDALHALAARRGVEFLVQADARLPPRVLGDSGALRQVLNNLLGNAIKFSAGAHGGGRIRLRLEPVGGDRVRITVADNGIGMGPEVLERIFKPFSQGESSTSRRYGGTGLGLSISRRLVELMGGDIQVSSSPGLGSEFTVTLPLEPAEAASVRHVLVVREEHGPPSRVADDATSVDGDALQPDVLQRAVALAAGAVPPAAAREPVPVETEHAAGAGGNDARQRILVAEDNEINQLVIARQLDILGYASEIVADGRAALERWRAGRYALLLTDLHMPEMDGYELSAAIRCEEPAGSHQPIIALTAVAMKGDDARCREAGMDDYLSKPVQLDRLKAMLQKWLPERQLQAAPPRMPAP